MIPQIIYLGILLIGLGVSMEKHGEIQKESKNNFFYSLLIASLNVGLLYWGGFFDGFFK